MAATPLIEELNERSREVFRRLVEAYLETGEPVGSRALTQSLNEKVSPATVRGVMHDLEARGLLGSQHVSSGRTPTETGLRMFVDGLLEVSDLTQDDRAKIDATVRTNQADLGTLMSRVGSALSAITAGASLVLTPKHAEAPIRHIEFVSIGPDQALVVLVFAEGQVENRLFRPPLGYTPSAMREAGNYLSAIAEGLTISELRQKIESDIARHRRDLDVLAQALVERGLALWAGEDGDHERLIVRGRANLIGEEGESGDIERIRSLFDDLERKRDVADFLELAEDGEGVRIFIGSENKLFSLSGSSLVVSPYMNADRKIIGAVGVIGPTRLNYGRIVPIVDYTAQLVGRLISDRG